MESNMKDKKQQAVPQSEAESFGIKRNPAVRAPRICLSEEEVIRIMRNEDAIKKKIGNLIDSMLCDDSQISEMDVSFCCHSFRRHVDVISACL